MSAWITFSLFKMEVFILWMLNVVEFSGIGLAGMHLNIHLVHVLPSSVGVKRGGLNFNISVVSES